MNLVRQTATYFAANVASAAFGLLNVIIFTRLIHPADYSIYVVGTSFAGILVPILSTWMRQAIMQEEAKGDGTDIRATILLGCLLSLAACPFAFFAGRAIMGTGDVPALAALFLAMMLGFFEVGQEILRARLHAASFMRRTIGRAILVSIFGTLAILSGGGGLALLVSSAVAYAASSIAALKDTWRGLRLRLSDPMLRVLFLRGMPITLSLSLLAVSTTIDRFVVAHLNGPAAAGLYGASVDLVRQALIIPAVSAASAFIPLAVRLLANSGAEATRDHLSECAELLLAVTVPACVGFAIVAPWIADLVLGPDFRETARLVMPIVAVSVIFQTCTQQYVYISFLLTNRNMFYIINTVAMIVFNTVLSYFLIARFGVLGAAWGRIAAELFGLTLALLLARKAFPMPLPMVRIARVILAVLAMTFVLKAVEPFIAGQNATVSLVVLVPLGGAAYAIAAWLLDIARLRERLGRSLPAFARSAR